MEKVGRNLPTSCFRRAQVEEVVCPADVSDPDGSHHPEPSRPGMSEGLLVQGPHVAGQQEGSQAAVPATSPFVQGDSYAVAGWSRRRNELVHKGKSHLGRRAAEPVSVEEPAVLREFGEQLVADGDDLYYVKMGARNSRSGAA